MLGCSVDEVKKLIDTIANKEQSGAWSPAQYNTVFAAVNYDFLKWRVGLPENYTVGNPQAAIAWQVSAKITDDVKDLIVKKDITIDGNGYFPIPDDYFAFSSWRYRYIENSECDEQPFFKDYKIDVLSDNELNEVLDNTITPPTLTYPKSAYYSYGLKVYPESISKILCTYLRIPKTPKWTFTIVDDEPVFNPSDLTLQNFEYAPSCLVDIANLCMIKLGVNLREETLVQYGMTRQKEGV